MSPFLVPVNALTPSALINVLGQRDTAFAVVSRAPLEGNRAVQEADGLEVQMGLVVGTDFNFDFNVSFNAGATQNGTAITTLRRWT